MGTVFSFDIRGEAAARASTAAAVDEAVHWLHEVDRLFSLYKPESELSRLARGELTAAECDPLVCEVLALCEAAEARSDGWFSTRYAGGLDPTGLVKGWAVERASRLLAVRGVGDSCINGGGDIQLSGHREERRPWRIGISDPLQPGELVAVVEGAGELAVATSGTAERGCHVLDPRTGAPPRHPLASVTVLARGLTAADAWATAAFARGSAARDWLEELPGVEAVAVGLDGSTWCTAGFLQFAEVG
ncbi:FAD:protein FMN transferase [Streptomyces sp. 8N616]|uniref:FAD:protein FMN transferase n=1 Tax=Streptomyces sp. 8N616 TaxID=3457414 RepID=UPI003FD48545